MNLVGFFFFGTADVALRLGSEIGISRSNELKAQHETQWFPWHCWANPQKTPQQKRKNSQMTRKSPSQNVMNLVGMIHSQFLRPVWDLRLYVNTERSPGLRWWPKMRLSAIKNFIVVTLAAREDRSLNAFPTLTS